MTVKLKDIIATFNLVGGEQIGSKQLFTGYSELYKANVYISYTTIIAFYTGEEWWLTDRWYSRTTTNHKRKSANLKRI